MKKKEDENMDKDDETHILIGFDQIPTVQKKEGRLFLNHNESLKLDRTTLTLEEKLVRFESEFEKAKSLSQQSSQPILLTLRSPTVSDHFWAQFLIDDYRVLKRDKSSEFPIVIQLLLDQGQIGIINLKDVLFVTSQDDVQDALLNCFQK